MQINTPVLDRPFIRNKGLTPNGVDREFWSDVLMSRPSVNQPDIIYNLVSSSGDRFVDNLSNPLIAVT